MVVAGLLLGILLIFVSGVLLGLRLQSTSQEQPNAPSFLPWKRPVKAPERKAPNITSFPRNVGSWRKQRKELERQHNSQQKMRDRGMASL